MAVFDTSVLLARPPEEVFAFFLKPALMIRIAPPELSLELLEGPEQLSLGARVKVRGRRWGIPHRATTEVTALEMNRLLTECQIEGIFRRWEMSHTFEADGAGTCVR